MYQKDTEPQPSWGWTVYEPLDGMTHVMPINDEHEHDFSLDCWCEPEEHEGVITHNSCDGREDYESGLRKPH